jgi:hypothetical protein
MKKYFLTILFIFALALFPKNAFASCMKKQTVEKEAKSSSLIFIGTATKITPAQIAFAVFPFSGGKIIWEKRFSDVDVVTFSVSEAFKGVSGETIEIATSADGDAGYKFEGGTWLHEGQTYLVYASKRDSAGTIPADITAEDMPKDIAKEFIRAYKSMPKKMVNEIDEFNNKVSPYNANVCGRTTQINYAAEEIAQLRKMFPDAKRFTTQSDAGKTVERETETATFLSKLLSFFGLA